jgi:hypothetical protein
MFIALIIHIRQVTSGQKASFFPEKASTDNDLIQ